MFIIQRINSKFGATSPTYDDFLREIFPTSSAENKNDELNLQKSVINNSAAEMGKRLAVKRPTGNNSSVTCKSHLFELHSTTSYKQMYLLKGNTECAAKLSEGLRHLILLCIFAHFSFFDEINKLN